MKAGGQPIFHLPPYDEMLLSTSKFSNMIRISYTSIWHLFLIFPYLAAYALQ